MAMTKAEQAQMDALKVRLALAWPPEPPKPIDVGIALAASDRPWVRGWWFNTNSRSVGLGITTGRLQSMSNYTDEQMAERGNGGRQLSWSQMGSGPWFATERDALMALHYAAALRCAEELHAISRQIEAASA